MKDQKNSWSRRRFIGSSVAGIAGAALIPGVLGCKSSKSNGDIRLGFIGMGRQSMFLLNGFIQIPGVQVIAGCDVYGIKRKRFEKRVSAFYAEVRGKRLKWKLMKNTRIFLPGRILMPL